MKIIFYTTLFIQFIFSQYVVKGEICDNKGNPISNATIQTFENNNYAISNENGYFDITIGGKEQFKVVVKHIGFNDLEIILDPSQKKRFKIILTASPIVNDEINVNANKSLMGLKDTPIVTHLLTEKDIQNSGSSNVIEILENALPNIQFIWDPHGIPTVKIQGYQTNNIAFLIDGQRISGEHAGNIDFEMLNLSNIERIEVIRGGMSTLYGSGAVGGVVNLITKQNKDKYWIEYVLSHDNPILISHSFNLGFNYKKINYSLSLSNKSSSGYDLTPASELSSGRVDKTLDENMTHVISSNIDYLINKKNKLNFNIKTYNRQVFKKFKTSGADEILYNIPTGTLIDAPELPIYNDLSYIIKYSKVLNQESNFTIAFQGEHYTKDIKYPYYDGNYPNIKGVRIFEWGDSRFNCINAIYKTTRQNHFIIIGFETIFNATSSKNILDQNSLVTYPSIFSVDTTYSSERYSLFLSDNFKINDNLYINGGIRINYNDDYKFKFSPSIGIKKNYNNNIFRINLSSNYRSPTVKELYYEFPQHSPPIYGNPNLEPQTSNYFSLSYENTKNSSIEMYYSNDYNRIGYRYVDPDPDIDGDSYYQSDNFKKVILYGMNASFNFKDLINNTDIKLTFSITDAPDEYKDYLSGVSKYSLKSTINYSLSKKVELALANKFLSSKTLYDENLEEYFMSNAFITFLPYSNFHVKIGVKNLFNYKDPRAEGPNSTDILTSYDPGRRFYINLVFKFKKERDDE